MATNEQQYAAIARQNYEITIRITLMKWVEWVTVCQFPTTRRMRELYAVLENVSIPLRIRAQAAEELSDEL